MDRIVGVHCHPLAVMLKIFREYPKSQKVSFQTWDHQIKGHQSFQSVSKLISCSLDGVLREWEFLDKLHQLKPNDATKFSKLLMAPEVSPSSIFERCNFCNVVNFVHFKCSIRLVGVALGSV